VPTVVVAALSARQLASSARRAGWTVHALDLFGDVDTRAAASRWTPIGEPDTLRIDGARFLAALKDACSAARCIGWIAGAGFEPQLHLLDAGARVMPLIGNGTDVAQRVRDPRRFFAALDGLGIAHPPTQFTPPRDPRGWLVKDFASSGGWHVRRADGTLPGAAEDGATGVYFQREAAGRPMSLLFLADGKRALPVATNALRFRAVGARPFVYHGAIGPVTDLPAHVPVALARAVDALADAFQLRGLGSLDVLVDGDTIRVLELNPRPTATLALYDADMPRGLVLQHVEACKARLPDAPLPIRSTRVRGESTVFTAQRCRIQPAHVSALTHLGCHDIPQPGTDVPAGAPLCTVAAHDTTVTHVDEQLATREAAVLALVQNRNEAANHAE
jgi:predicted ATP-grasp superfamily ATP-dependent carboligase